MWNRADLTVTSLLRAGKIPFDSVLCLFVEPLPHRVSTIDERPYCDNSSGNSRVERLVGQ